MSFLLIRLMTFSFPKKAFPSAHAWRTANAALTRAFRHLRDCDTALHRRRGESRPRSSLDSPRSFAARHGGNRIKDGDPHHDHVRSRLSLIEINRVKRHGAPMPIYRHPTFTVARMPQGKAKSSFPHEP
ncbi:MAG TPA: hypothetical protein VGH12_01365 [Steroidobacteraceae bacterium]|jgi:hypothetical protein